MWVFRFYIKSHWNMCSFQVYETTKCYVKFKKKSCVVTNSIYFLRSSLYRLEYTCDVVC